MVKIANIRPPVPPTGRRRDKERAVPPENHTARVPEGDRFGGELDGDAMTRWSAHLAEHGQISHFNDPAGAGRCRLPLN